MKNLKGNKTVEYLQRNCFLKRRKGFKRNKQPHQIQFQEETIQFILGVIEAVKERVKRNAQKGMRKMEKELAISDRLWKRI